MKRHLQDHIPPRAGVRIKRENPYQVLGAQVALKQCSIIIITITYEVYLLALELRNDSVGDSITEPMRSGT